MSKPSKRIPLKVLNLTNQVPECVLGDKATRIFLNTKGQNDDEVSEELIAFLHYLENTTDEAAKQSGSEKIQRIHRYSL